MRARSFLVLTLALAGLAAAPTQTFGYEPEFPDWPWGEPPIPPPPSQPASTSFEFRLPTGQPSPPYRSSSLTVANDDVFRAFDEAEAEFKPLIESAIRNTPGVRSLNPIQYSLPVPTFILSGEQTSVVATIAGFETVHISGRFRPDDSVARFFCGSRIFAALDLQDLSIEIAYDFYTGDPVTVDLLYERLDVDYDCNYGIFGELVEILNDIFEFADVTEFAIDALSGAAEAAGDTLNGRFANRFALDDVLDGLRESGPREIRQQAEEAVRILGGLRSAV
ncbi:MAG: hypothetical protein QNK03_01635, partial [Myxococcota bacterium]|nr:hypothetical protein [Myxococcota bacterium]